MKFLKSIIQLIVLLVFTSNLAFSQTAAVTNPTTDGLTTMTVKVKGVTCALDLGSISANVVKVKGVDSCISGKRGATTTFEVKYNAVIATEKQIYAAIEDTGGCKNPNDRPYKVKL